MNKVQYSGRIIHSVTGFLRVVLVILLAGISTDSCIYPYYPEIKDVQELLAIDGHIIKGLKVQTITITRSTAYNKIRFLPELGCLVKVVDDKGKVFNFSETGKGIYSAEIPDDLIQYNTSYQLFVTTPGNQNYESTPELLLQDTPVDSVYCNEEPGQTAATGNMEGIQFYVDIKAKEGNARNYRWVMEETYEYHRTYPMEVKYDGTKKKVIVLPINNDTMQVCYVTKPVGGYYSSSTANLRLNEKKRIPLNYVSNRNPRLKYRYSLLVNQYSLSESAFNYFNTQKMELQESGGLYEVQPLQTTSNLINSDVPDEKVLGYFWASSFSQKRVFSLPPYHFFFWSYCLPHTIDWNAVGHADYYPSFYITKIEGVEYTAENECFDCTQTGGVTQVPEFWKNQ
jgi:hypothetical protein